MKIKEESLPQFVIFSTETKPHNRGFGLNTILSNVKVLKGTLLIVSGKVRYWLWPDGSINVDELDVTFPGTLFVIYLDSNELPAKELEENEVINLI